MPYYATQPLEKKTVKKTLVVLTQGSAMNAVDIARSTNAHIGIVANGKAFYFYKDMLEDMEQKAGHIIKIGHLIALCAEQGKDISINSTRCSLSLNALDISEEQWLSELKETDDTEYEEEDETEDDDKEKEDIV